MFLPTEVGLFPISIIGRCSMSALDIIPLSVALQSRAEDLTALAQQHAQERKTDNGFLKTVGDIVTAVPSTAGGMVASAINPVLGAAYWGTLGYGEGANLAQQMGASYGQQALYGGADAIVSMLTGSLDLPGAAKAPVTELFNRELLDQGIKAILR